eukprot:Gb_28109 [translate_table: standard]
MFSSALCSLGHFVHDMHLSGLRLVLGISFHQIGYKSEIW